MNSNYLCEQTIQEWLENESGLKLNLKINNNRSTMLSVKWEPDCTKLSLHRMFLQAPKNIMEELACYLRKQHTKITPPIMAYIEDNIQKLDYSYQLDLSKLQPKGHCYDLNLIYDHVNQDYFNQSLGLFITWFGKREHFSRSKVTFGLYHDPLRLIKINRFLDNSVFPEFLVSFIVYHEMLHYVCPSYIDEKGLKHIHSKIFREKEKEFKYYNDAQRWISDHQHLIFSGAHHYQR